MVKYMLTFSSTHKVLKAEKALKEKAVPFRLAPAPPALSLYCDLVITVDDEALGQAVTTLDKTGPKPAAVYRKEGGGYVKV